MIPRPVAGVYFGQKYTNFKTLAEAKGFLEYLISTQGPCDQEPDALFFEAFKATTRGIGPSIQEILSHKESTPPKPEHLYQIGLIKYHKEVPEPASQAPRPSGPVVSLSDLTSDPSGARQALRKAGIAKPGGRWEWPSDHPDLTKIKKIIS